MANLSPRQRRLYVHTIDLWRIVETVDEDGDPSHTYTLAYEDVPCYFEIRQSVEGPSLAGRIESDNIFTRDGINVAHDQEVDSDWVAVNRTLHVDGTQSQNYGRYWIISGQPQSISRAGGRRAEKRHLEAIQVFDIDEVIAEHYE